MLLTKIKMAIGQLLGQNTNLLFVILMKCLLYENIAKMNSFLKSLTDISDLLSDNALQTRIRKLSSST